MRNVDQVPTRQLFELAGWAVFVACVLTLARLWHPQTFTVVHADPTSAPVTAGIASRSGGVAQP
jgi:hypothetical protein